MKDLHALPRIADSISFLYIEKASIEQDAFSVTAFRKNERVPIPAAGLTTLFIGPGTTISHAAVKTLADCGCMVIWCGEGVSKFYASGMGETRSAENLLGQVTLFSNEEAHMRVVRRMYQIRFPKMDCTGKTLQQIRGMEGIRVREAYKLWSKTTGVRWRGRSYKDDDWDAADPINRSLSIANAVLYGVCHAAIVSLGYSPALGFIHTGKMLSFVYDVADLYKAETTIPAAFTSVARSENAEDAVIRLQTRRFIKQQNVMRRIAGDIAWIFEKNTAADENAKGAGELWDDAFGTVAGGANHAGRFDVEDEEEEEW